MAQPAGGASPKNRDHEGRQMKGDKSAAAAKSSPEWRSRRANEGRQMKAGAAKSRPEWRSCMETHEGYK